MSETGETVLLAGSEDKKEDQEIIEAYRAKYHKEPWYKDKDKLNRAIGSFSVIMIGAGVILSIMLQTFIPFMIGLALSCASWFWTDASL